MIDRNGSERKHDQSNETTGVGRRTFIRRAGLGAGALGVAAVAGGKVAPAQAAAAKPQGYRETEHVKTYYKLAKF